MTFLCFIHHSLRGYKTMNTETNVVKETKVFHADHSMTEEQRAWAIEQFQLAVEPYPQALTFAVPFALGTVPNALWGPTSGDAPILELDVVYTNRGRDWNDRMVDLPCRPSNEITVIGMETADAILIFTMHGGKPAAQNPADPNCADVEAAKEFWKTHALSSQGM
jgi:hypothetical protein